MITEKNQNQRFLRDSPPFLESFERVVGDLVILQKNSSEYMVPITMELVKHIQDHFSECKQLLAKAEALVVDAREQGLDDDEIEKRVVLCREIQRLQTDLADDVEGSIQKIIDRVFPR